jgi:NAD(P)-dependent dehydrogenase (short-subunit alcohol dehydrogenase family)
MFSLESRVAVVTGGGNGIGQRVAVGFALAGATVVPVDIDQGGLEHTAALVREASGREGAVMSVNCDVSAEEQVRGLFEHIATELGRVDVLLNGAFTPLVGRPHDLSLESWQRVLRVNLTGYFLCARAAGQAMLAAGRGGSIINISSIAGVSALGRGNFAYSVTKGGIVQMTRELAVEWGRFGVRVNAILPAQTRTKGFQARLDYAGADADGLMARVVGSIPLGRIADPTDFVGPALFLASDAAAMVTGVLLPVDGGNLAMNAGARADD